MSDSHDKMSLNKPKVGPPSPGEEGTKYKTHDDVPVLSGRLDYMEEAAHAAEGSAYGYASNELNLDEVNDNLQDCDDNLSLEVNFGDGSSCHASDVSSLSFQNAVLDDGDNLDSEIIEVSGSRRDSADSSDSIPNDFPSETDPADLEEEIQRKMQIRKKDPDCSLSEDEGDSEDTGTMKRRGARLTATFLSTAVEEQSCRDILQNVAQEWRRSQERANMMNFESTPNYSKELLPSTGADHEELDPIWLPQSSGVATLPHVTESSATASLDAAVNGMLSSAADGGVKKRNSLEVRNNIPNVNEVKSYEGDRGPDLIKYTGPTTVPKMRKKSPGLARRLDDNDPKGSERDTSSSERDSEQPALDTSVISAQQKFENQLRNGDVSAYNALSKAQGSTGSSAQASPTKQADMPEKNPDIENEYDYVKYARIQHGDSYVGMRLAYSSSNDSLSFKRNQSGMRSDEDHGLPSSHENSPEKTMHSPGRRGYGDQGRLSKVNEDTLTEIPLNGSETQQEERNFSLSPEATECDSAEVESVLSEDGGKSSTSGMLPNVEDGLSSSQGSDTEDASTLDQHHPTEILKKRYRSQIEAELNAIDREPDPEPQAMETPARPVSSSSSQPSTLSQSETDLTNKEAVDAAIQDIKSAIEKTKQMALRPPSKDQNSGEEPVWVMR